MSNGNINISAEKNLEVQLKGDSLVKYPDTLWEKVKWLGPSFLLAGIAIGSGEAIIDPSFAARLGITVLWIPVFSALCKSFITERLARYTMATGGTFAEGLMKLPGPRGWAIWISFIPFLLLGFFTSAGWALGVGTGVYAMINRLGFEINGVIVVKLFSFITLVSGCIITLKGYNAAETAAKILVATLVICVILAAIAVFPPINNFIANILPTNFFKFTPREIGGMAKAIGYSGGGVMAISSYTYWVREKKYHIYASKSKEDFKKWSNMYAIDLAVSYIIQPVVGLLVIVVAGSTLFVEKLYPSGIDVVLTTANMLSIPLGDWAYWIWLIGASAILFSTVIGVFDGWSRCLADAIRLVIPALQKYEENLVRNSIILFFTLGGVLFSVFGLPTPQTFVGLGSITEGVFFYPVFTALAVILVHTQLPKEKQGSILITILAVLAAIAFAYVGINWAIHGDLFVL